MSFKATRVAVMGWAVFVLILMAVVAHGAIPGTPPWETWSAGLRVCYAVEAFCHVVMLVYAWAMR